MSHFIDGQWSAGGGAEFTSHDPATGETVWQGRAAGADEVDSAITAARSASESWAETDFAERAKFVEAFAAQLKSHRAELAEAISHEVGKPRWESLTEVDTMIGKVPVSLEAMHERRRATTREASGSVMATRFKPHGVVAVFGPFNFPGHLPNGHIVPALLSGNTVVFKPSELTPLVAEKTIELWEAAGLPRGVINLIQGGRDTGVGLSGHRGIDGLFFTGSAEVGKALSRALADRPQTILALELGGNNPLIVHETTDIATAAYITVQSAFLTAGQRCTCARRLIVPMGSSGDAFLERLIATTRTIRVGPFTELPEPFMGPVISDAAAEKILAAQKNLLARGAVSFMESKSIGRRPALLTPGILDVTAVADRPDTEIFGPLLQVIRVPNFDAALDEANRSAFGLSASLLSDNRDLYERFFRKIRAGVVNWNHPTTGASGTLPFGGIGQSGNHRPSGYYAADYCSYPIASVETPRLSMPARPTPGLGM